MAEQRLAAGHSGLCDFLISISGNMKGCESMQKLVIGGYVSKI